jgi:hypothetical protein
MVLDHIQDSTAKVGRELYRIKCQKYNIAMSVKGTEPSEDDEKQKGFN